MNSITGRRPLLLSVSRLLPVVDHRSGSRQGTRPRWWFDVSLRLSQCGYSFPFMLNNAPFFFWSKLLASLANLGYWPRRGCNSHRRPSEPKSYFEKLLSDKIFDLWRFLPIIIFDWKRDFSGMTQGLWPRRPFRLSEVRKSNRQMISIIPNDRSRMQKF